MADVKRGLKYQQLMREKLRSGLTKELEFANCPLSVWEPNAQVGHLDSRVRAFFLARLFDN